MWNVKTGEKSPSWCKLCVFTLADVQWFMLPIFLHQAKGYIQDPHLNPPLEWIVHHATYGYIDIHGWIKSIIQLYTVCGTSTINNIIILFNGNNHHLYKRALIYMEDQNTKPLVLKAGNYGNDQTNFNGMNKNLKYYLKWWKGVLDAEVRDDTLFTFPHGLNPGGSMGRL